MVEAYYSGQYKDLDGDIPELLAISNDERVLKILEEMSTSEKIDLLHKIDSNKIRIDYPDRSNASFIYRNYYSDEVVDIISSETLTYSSKRERDTAYKALKPYKIQQRFYFSYSLNPLNWIPSNTPNPGK